MTINSILITFFISCLSLTSLNAVRLPENPYLPTLHFQSSYPYITGDTVRESCTHIFDPTRSFDPLNVKCGDTIFVFFDYLEYFFAMVHPKIPEPYILVSHHFFDSSDDPVPGLGLFASYLDNEKLIGWFTHNIDRTHPKLYPLPIGIANAYYGYGNKKKFDDSIEKFAWKVGKRIFLYMNFSIHTYEKERRFVFDFFKGKPFCQVSQTKPLENYLQDLAYSKFILSPRGNGLDCFRTWEALLLGCYPVVKSSTLDVLFEDLPVVIVNDWNEVTEEFLQMKYEEFSSKEYNWDRLYMPYWLDQIRAVKENYLKTHGG